MPDKLLDELLDDSSTETKESDILFPLMFEINQIQDPTIRDFVRSVLMRSPSYFWSAPASFSGENHPPDERDFAGNVLHTKRVVRIVCFIANAQERSHYEVDILIAAAILHDLTKCVVWADGTLHYDAMHPYTVDRFVEWVRREDNLASSDGLSSSLYIEEDVLHQILRLIRCHMGMWSPIPETIPITTLDWTLHLADLLASKLHIIVDGEVNEERWKLNPGP